MLLRGLTFQTLTFECRIAENDDCPSHRGDLVVGADLGEGKIGFPGGQPSHAVVDSSQRVHELALDIKYANAPGHENGADRNDQKRRAVTGEALEHLRLALLHV